MTTSPPPTAPVNPPLSVAKIRFPWRREAKIFVIHSAIWIAGSLVVGVPLILYMPADVLLKSGSSLAAHSQNVWGYVGESILLDCLCLLPIHGCYVLFWYTILRTGRDTTGRFVAYFGFFVLYFLALAFLTGVYAGFRETTGRTFFTSRDATVFILFVWFYSMVFVMIRAYRHNKRIQRELERQKTQAELAALKAQVNPHFLFNTLNNLYGTALTGDSDRTAAGIEHLSGVMRHVVEESKRDRTPIGKEIRFLEDTVELHQMRLPRIDTIRVQSEMSWDEQPAEIAPLLLVSFVENAFKYGISVSQPCFVDIRLTVENGQLSFRCRNSVIPNNRLESSTGTGIDNVRQRLSLLYANRHTLTIREENDVFDVELELVL